MVLKKRYVPLTIDTIHQALSQCRKIVMQDQKSGAIFEMPSNKPAEAKQIYEALGINYRSETRQIARIKASVVCTQLGVTPEAFGIPGEHKN